jgi:hypothetical protein
LPQYLIAIVLAIALFEVNININANIVLSKNEMPFLKISMLVAAITLILLFIFFKYTNFGVLGMIVAPGIAECLHWGWMSTAIRELKIASRDICYSLHNLKNIINLRRCLVRGIK